MKKLILLIIIISLCFGLWGADSTRTRAGLETIFADNTSGNISAQDLRDFLASVYVKEETDSTKFVYQALMTQTGITAPTEQYVLVNTFGTKPIWTRFIEGMYYATLDSTYGIGRIFATAVSRSTYNSITMSFDDNKIAIINYDLQDSAISDTVNFVVEIQVKE